MDNMTVVLQGIFDIFICIFVNEKFGILIKIPLKFVPKGFLIDHIPAMLARFTDAYMGHWREMSPYIAKFEISREHCVRCVIISPRCRDYVCWAVQSGAFITRVQYNIILYTALQCQNNN